MPSVSVIVTTYNDPRALALVLAGLGRQTVQAFDVVIADDGSAPETRAFVDRFARRASFEVRYVWQPDRGFRKCAILNKAVCAAPGEYLVFLDGDCIPPRHSLAAHLAAARPNRYVSSAKVLVQEPLCGSLSTEAVAAGAMDRVGLWWRHVGKRRRLAVSWLPGLRYLCDRNREEGGIWRGENSSTFAEHVLQVGGFDERFGYGFEDADFGLRLEAAGVRGYSLRYLAPVFHLEHPRPHGNPKVVARNRALMEANRAAGVVVTPYGIMDGRSQQAGRASARRS